MDYHEIVNENFNNNPIAITYCPLTGTAIGWQSEINNIKLDLGVSGLLYNNNLIAFDRNTGTLISQMLSRGINGSLSEEEARNINLVEMNIDSWKNLYPNAKVLSFDTGFDRDYQRYPYGNYRTVNDLLFPQQIIDKRLFAKERVLGVKESNAAKAFRFSTVENSLVESNIGGKDIIIFTGPGGSSYLQAYYAEASYGKLSFEKVSDNSKAVAKDQFNNRYDIFGQVIEGPNAGAQLGAPVAYIGYWVAWSSFEKNIPIYNE